LAKISAEVPENNCGMPQEPSATENDTAEYAKYGEGTSIEHENEVCAGFDIQREFWHGKRRAENKFIEF